MKTIYKYPILIDDEVAVAAPRGAKFRHVGRDPIGLGTRLWLEVDTDAPVVEHTFYVRGTGQQLPGDTQHLATWVDGTFVWHLFA